MEMLNFWQWNWSPYPLRYIYSFPSAHSESLMHIISIHIGFMCPVALQILDTCICSAKVFTYIILFRGLMSFLMCFRAPKDACGPDQNCSGSPAVLLRSLSSGSLNRKNKQMSCQCRGGPNSVLVCCVAAGWLRASQPHIRGISVLRKWSNATKHY